MPKDRSGWGEQGQKINIGHVGEHGDNALRHSAEDIKYNVFFPKDGVYVVEGLCKQYGACRWGGDIGGGRESRDLADTREGLVGGHGYDGQPSD